VPALPDSDREGARRRPGNVVLPALSAGPLVAYATSMTTTDVDLACSRCGRAAPGDSDELVTWRHGSLALQEEIGEGLLLCPECDADDAERVFEEGEGG